MTWGKASTTPQALTMGKRARRAAGVLLALFVLLFCLSAANACQGPSVVQEVLSSDTWEIDANGGGFMGLTATLQEGIPAGDAADYLSDDFTQEVINPQGFELRWSEQSKTVGLIKEGDASSVYDEFVQQLLDRGWYECGENKSTQGTFQKSEGRYRWLYICSTQVGSKATTVIQYG